MLYEAYFPSLVRPAWMMTGSRAEAEDIVHDAFLRFASGRHPVPEHPLAYLRRAVADQVRDGRDTRWWNGATSGPSTIARCSRAMTAWFGTCSRGRLPTSAHARAPLLDSLTLVEFSGRRLPAGDDEVAGPPGPPAAEEGVGQDD